MAGTIEFLNGSNNGSSERGKIVKENGTRKELNKEGKKGRREDLTRKKEGRKVGGREQSKEKVKGKQQEKKGRDMNEKTRDKGISERRMERAV